MFFAGAFGVCVEGEFAEGLILVCVVIIVLEKREKDLGRLWAGLVSGVWVLVLFVAVFGVVLNVPVVRAGGTIYIRADGSIDSPTAPITSADNITYTFTDNINDSIVVERSNIIIDGNGYTLQGSGSGNGFTLSRINNVTLKGVNINSFAIGVYLLGASYNGVSGNNITNNNDDGVSLATYVGGSWEYSRYNVISGNNITDNAGVGVYFEAGSFYNTIS